MKLSVAVASAEAPPTAFVVWRGWEESIRKAAALGYQGVELALRDAAEIDPRDLERWLGRSGLEVSCLSTGQVFAVSRLWFTHPDPARRAEAVRVLTGLVELAGRFGGMVNLGRVRGMVAEGQSRAQAEEWFIDATRRVCDEGLRHGVTLLIEPVNRYETNFLNRVGEAAEILARVDRPNLGIMPDAFHMNIEEVRLSETLARHGPLVRYVHLADSNRLAPGWGHLDFADLWEGLRQARFDGWAAVEILPEPDPDAAAAQAARFLLPRCRAHALT